MRLLKFIFILLLNFNLIVLKSQELEPKITMERKKIIILTNKEKDAEITEKIYHIISSVATQLNRYDVIDRNQLDQILKEQQLQYSGLIDQNQAVEIGKVAAANEALFVQIQNFGQKGVPTEEQKEKEEEKEPETGLLGWVVKEVVKAEIDKEMKNIERYPNNINTIIDGEVKLINIKTGETQAAFHINADHTGGIKSKSLSESLKQIRSQIYSNLKSFYKLNSEVLDVRKNDVTILLGENMGVKSGTLFEIITREEKKIVRDREITIPGKSVGFVEVKTISIDASQGKILRRWDDIKPGYQAEEITGGIFSGGISGIYGISNSNIRLRLFGVFNPFHQFGGSIFGDIGTVKDSRDDTDLQLGLGIDLIYRFLFTSSLSIGSLLSLPFDFHFRSDDGYNSKNNQTVFLPIFSPRIGIQSEVMLGPSLDIVIRGEYVVTSLNLDNQWTYTDVEDDTNSLPANWDPNEGFEPEIDYRNFQFNIGFRSIFID